MCFDPSLPIKTAHSAAICVEIKVTFLRKVLVLNGRTEPLDAILAGLMDKVQTPFVLHGRISKKLRATGIAEMESLPPDPPRILFATSKLVGEGFDHPPLDTHTRQLKELQLELSLSKSLRVQSARTLPEGTRWIKRRATVKIEPEHYPKRLIKRGRGLKLARMPSKPWRLQRRCHGRARCNSTVADCIVSTQPSPSGS